MNKKLKMDRDLNDIGESYQSLLELNEMANSFAEKRHSATFNVWYLPNLKTWQMLSYVGSNGECTQLRCEIGIEKLESFFSSPITTINNFFKEFKNK